MASLGNMYATLGLVVTPLQSGLRSAEQSIRSFERNTAKSFTNWEKKNNTAFMRMQKNLFNLRTAFAAGIGIAVARDIINTAVSFEKLDLKMTAATGSSQQAAIEMGFVRAESERLGLRLKTSADMFGTLAAAAKETSLQGAGVRDIFTAISEAGTVLQLNGEDVKGALFAISQMISKGKVSMEELRQQLGERIPGALLLAQRAMGMTGLEFDKLITKGNLTAQEFLPKLAKEIRKTYGSAVPAAMKATQSEMNRFMNTWDEMKITIAKGGMLTALRFLMKAFIETYKFINFATTAFVGNILRIWEGLNFAFDLVALGMRKIWNESIQLMVDSLNWFIRKASAGLSVFGPLTKHGVAALDKLADRLDKFSESGQFDFMAEAGKLAAGRAQALKGITDVEQSRFNDLYGTAPVFAPQAAVQEPSPVSPETTKAISSLATLRKQMMQDLNASVVENQTLEDNVHNRKLVQAQVEFNKRVGLLDAIKAKGVNVGEEELLNRANFEEQLSTIAINARTDLLEKLKTARAANIQDEVIKAQTSLNNLDADHQIRIAMLHALRDEGINVEAQITAAHALNAEKRKKAEENVFKARLAGTASVIGSLTSINAAFQSTQEGASRKEFERNKKMSIAMALVNTALGAVTAFAQTPGAIYVKLAAAGAAVAAGMAQVSNIRKQQFGGGGGVSAAGGGGGAAGGASSVNTDVPSSSNQGQNGPQEITVHLSATGDIIDLDQWMANKGAPAFKKLLTTGVDFGINQDAVTL